jgi:hypothetical protein
MQSTNPQPNLSFQLPPLPPVQEKYVHFFACCGCQSKIKITCKSPFIEVTFQGTTSIQSGPQVQVTFSHFSNQTYFINLSSSFQEYQQQQQSVPRYASVAEFFDIDDLWPELFDDNQTEVQPNYNFPPPNTTASTAATTTTTTVTGDQQQWQQMQQRTPSPVMVTHQRHHHHPPPVQQLPPQPPPQQPPPPRRNSHSRNSRNNNKRSLSSRCLKMNPREIGHSRTTTTTTTSNIYSIIIHHPISPN